MGTLAAFDALTSATLFRDEVLRRTAMQLWAESASKGGTSDLLIDGLTQVLIARLPRAGWAGRLRSSDRPDLMQDGPVYQGWSFELPCGGSPL